MLKIAQKIIFPEACCELYTFLSKDNKVFLPSLPGAASSGRMFTETRTLSLCSSPAAGRRTRNWRSPRARRLSADVGDSHRAEGRKQREQRQRLPWILLQLQHMGRGNPLCCSWPSAGKSALALTPYFFIYLPTATWLYIYFWLGGIKLRLLGLSGFYTPEESSTKKENDTAVIAFPSTPMSSGEKRRIEHSCLFRWNIYSLYSSYWVLKSPPRRKRGPCAGRICGSRAELRPPGCPWAAPAAARSASGTTSLLPPPSRWTAGRHGDRSRRRQNSLTLFVIICWAAYRLFQCPGT